MLIKLILVLGLTVITLVDIAYCMFYSGTFSWKKDDHSNKVHFVYRMAWQKGKGPCGSGCNQSDVGKDTSLAYPWLTNISFFNDKTLLGDVHYVITDVSTTNMSGWEQGESSYVLTPSSNQSIVYLNNVPWIASGTNNSKDLGYLQTTIDTRVRNDTNRSNISPIASVPPYIGVQFGCKTTVRIPADDPDGDRIMCRWARPSECRGGCTNVPLGSVHLHESNCSLTIDTRGGGHIKAGKFYRLSIVIEDYPDYNVSVGSDSYTKQRSFSQIPYQVSLWVSRPNVQCGHQNMTFVTATPINNISIFLTIFDLRLKHNGVNTSFYVQTDIHSSFEFVVSGPHGLSREILPDDLSAALNRSDIVKLNVVWKPDYRSQTGGSQICVWGLNILNGLTTDARCFTVFSGDFNQCSTQYCSNSGTCKNVYGLVEKCICKPGFTDQFCSKSFTGQTCSVTYPGTVGNHTSNSANSLDQHDCQDGGDNRSLLWAIISGILGFVFLTTLIIVVYKLMHINKRNSSQHSRQGRISPLS